MMMGWLTASGSLARTIGPIFVSQVYNDYGPRVTFIAMIIIVFLTTVLYLLGSCQPTHHHTLKYK
jgi:ceroid-lipofuscinosis MFS transporter 7